MSGLMCLVLMPLPGLEPSYNQEGKIKESAFTPGVFIANQNYSGIAEILAQNS